MPLLPVSVYGDGADAGYGLPLPMSVADKTAVDSRQKAMKPKSLRSLSFPLNEIAGNITGSRTSPEAIAAGAVDLGLDAASLYPPTARIAIPIKSAANALNTIDEDFWKDLGEPYREKREGFKKDIKRNLNAKENELINLFKPPIPYVDY